MRKYKPSNGTEGMIFWEKYCMNCTQFDPLEGGTKDCDIMMRSMMYDIEDPEYPEEFTIDETNAPICTKWQQWDWETMGDPDDPENPNKPQTEDPNQLKLF